MAEIYVGVDVSEDWLDVARLEGVGLTPMIRFGNHAEGLAELCSLLKASEGLLVVDTMQAHWLSGRLASRLRSIALPESH